MEHPSLSDHETCRYRPKKEYSLWVTGALIKCVLGKLQEATDSFIDPQRTSLAYAALAVGVQASIPDIFLSQGVDSGSNGCERARPIRPMVPCGVQATLRQRNDPKKRGFSSSFERCRPSSADSAFLAHRVPSSFGARIYAWNRMIFATLASSLVDST